MNSLQNVFSSWESAAVFADVYDVFCGGKPLDVFEHLSAVGFDDDDFFGILCGACQGILGEGPERDGAEQGGAGV